MKFFSSGLVYIAVMWAYPNQPGQSCIAVWAIRYHYLNNYTVWILTNCSANSRWWVRSCASSAIHYLYTCIPMRFPHLIFECLLGCCCSPICRAGLFVWRYHWGFRYYKNMVHLCMPFFPLDVERYCSLPQEIQATNKKCIYFISHTKFRRYPSFPLSQLSPLLL